MRAIKGLMMMMVFTAVSLVVMMSLVTIAVITFFSGMWSLDLRITQDSMLLREIASRTGYVLETPEPLDVHFGHEFTLRGSQVKVRASGESVAEYLFEVDHIAFEGLLDMGVLWGKLPHFNFLRAEGIKINLEQDFDGRIKWPKVAETTSSQSGQSLSLIAAAHANDLGILESWPIQEMNLRDVHLRLYGMEDPVELTLSNVDFIKPMGSKAGFIRSNGALNALPIEVDVDIAQQGRVSGTLDFAGLNTRIQGIMASETGLEVEAVLKDSALISRLFSVPLPSGPFAFNGVVRHVEKTLEVEIERLSGLESSLSGRIDVDLNERAVRGTIDAQHLVIAEFLPADGMQGDASQSALDTARHDDGRAIPEIALPEMLLHAPFILADVRLDIKASTLLSGVLQLDNVAVGIFANAEGITLNVERLELGSGGKINGVLDIRAGIEPRINSKMQIHSLPITSLQPFIPAISNFDGVVNADFEGMSFGEDLRALAAHFEGTGAISFYDGHIVLPEAAQEVLTSISPTILEDGVLIVKCANLRGNFIDGVSNDLDGALLSGALMLYGGGELDLGEERIDARTMIELDVLGTRMGLPFRFGGTFMKPLYEPQLQTLISGDVSDPVMLPKEGGSNCHDDIARLVSGKYEGLPGFVDLDASGRSGDIERQFDVAKERVQERLQSTIDQGADGLLKSLLSN